MHAAYNPIGLAAGFASIIIIVKIIVIIVINVIVTMNTGIITMIAMMENPLA